VCYFKLALYTEYIKQIINKIILILYIVNNINMKNVGSRAEVFHGTAEKTSGGLKKKDLFKDKYGNIKSKRRSAIAKKKSNLGNYLNERGMECFVLRKKLDIPNKPGTSQKGGSVQKKQIEQLIFKNQDEEEVMLIPEEHNGHYDDLHIDCKCPLRKKIKHHMCDHIEDVKHGFIFPDMEYRKDIDFFIIPKNGGRLDDKELKKQCKCDIKKIFNVKHKISDHMIGDIDNMTGGAVGAVVGGVVKGLAALIRVIAKGVVTVTKGAVKVFTVVGKQAGKILVKVVKIGPTIVTKIVKVTAAGLKKLIGVGANISRKGAQVAVKGAMAAARGVGKGASAAARGVGKGLRGVATVGSKAAKGFVPALSKGLQTGRKGLGVVASRGAKVGQQLLTKGANIAKQGVRTGARVARNIGTNASKTGIRIAKGIGQNVDMASGPGVVRTRAPPAGQMPRMPTMTPGALPAGFNPSQMLAEAKNFVQQNPQLVQQATNLLKMTPQLAQKTVTGLLQQNPQLLQQQQLTPEMMQQIQQMLKKQEQVQTQPGNVPTQTVAQ
jgi:hypothetical protein